MSGIDVYIANCLEIQVRPHYTQAISPKFRVLAKFTKKA